MSWNDWMNSVFGTAAPPPPVPGPYVGPLNTQPADAAPLPSPVPGCDADSWAAYEALLVLREGEKYKVYYDSLGKPTGGIGHLLLPSDGLVVGQTIPDAAVKRWFQHDGATAMDYAVAQCKEAGITSQAFLPYLASVCYQLGGLWTKKFPNTWAMIVRGDYATAANVVPSSLWATQTPVRAADFEKALRALPLKVKS
jgi:GH24 family phage-related lysozyme (muramidase)